MLRASKDAGEVALIEEAAGMATRALHTTLEQVRPGLSELEIAGILEHALRNEGSETYPFESIVASGERAALPHAHAGRRIVQPGDFLLLDFGATTGGYCSDVTRTVVVGRATQEQRDVYDIVRAANERATAGLVSGITGKAADAIARDYITAAGFGDHFGHSLGHGIGLEVHEAPRLARTAEDALPPDTVVTIEPGIYRAGWGGVRIEDDVYLSAAGPRVLTDFTHDLLELTA
jgi:Xaa-Pro aminopeptidase